MNGPTMTYKKYVHDPSGKSVPSVVQAWRLHNGVSSSKVSEQSTPLAKKPRVREDPRPPPATEAPTARKRIVRLPEPEDEMVGKRIWIHLADEGGKYRSAEIQCVKMCLDGSGKGCKGYTIRYDKDGKIYHDVELDKSYDHPDGFLWKPFCVDDQPDEPDEGVSSPPPSSDSASPPPAPLRQHQLPLQQHQPQLSKAAGKRPLQEASSGRRVRSASTASAAQPPPEAGDRAGEWTQHSPISQCVADAIEMVLARARDESAAAAGDLPIVRKLRAIEWFAGTARLSFALAAQGVDIIIHDRDPNVVEWAAHGRQPDPNQFWSDDFLSVDEAIFYTTAPYDFMHFGIDCRSFSGLGHAGQGRSEDNHFLGSGLSCPEGNQLLNKAMSIIDAQLKRNPNFLFTIENPFYGRMQNHPMVAAKLEVSRDNGGLGATRIVLDYCWFWDGKGERPFHKRTIIWTNSPTLIHEFGEHKPPTMKSRFVCERATPCQWYGILGHRSVNSKTAREATPYPSLLVSRIAQGITLDLSKQRWRPL
jgi:hypothetical protein